MHEKAAATHSSVFFNIDEQETLFVPLHSCGKISKRETVKPLCCSMYFLYFFLICTFMLSALVFSDIYFYILIYYFTFQEFCQSLMF